MTPPAVGVIKFEQKMLFFCSPQALKGLQVLKIKRLKENSV